MVLSWQLIWDMNLLMQLKSFSLMKKENLTLRRQTKYCPRDWRIQSGQSFLDSMDLIRTEQSIHFPEEDLILQVLS